MLLDAGAATDLQGESGGTALTRASDRGYPEIVRLLLERGANTDIQNSLGYTALMWGSARGHVEVVRMLLQAGARLDLVNIDGDSALIEACRKSHVEVHACLHAFAHAAGWLARPQMYVSYMVYAIRCMYHTWYTLTDRQTE